uniref:Calmodulin-lysine N-methyltransferase n=1 Tax=Bicosoecida sp. CB-2014 TaxID=1486930 RepID=A0A7S1CGG7_9STRA
MASVSDGVRGPEWTALAFGSCVLGGDAEAAGGMTTAAATVRVLAEGARVGAVVGSDAGAHDDVTHTMLWPASHGMAEFMCAALSDGFRGRHAAIVPNEALGTASGPSIVELGAGAGHVGLCAALLNKAGLTVITDGATGAVKRIREAAIANGLALDDDGAGAADDDGAERADRDVAGRVVVCELKWGEVASCAPLAVRRQRFDVVVAAEVVYPASTAEAVAALFDTAGELLRPPAAADTSGPRSAAGRGGGGGGGGASSPRSGELPAVRAAWAPPYFALLYVERRRETTRLLLESAWAAGWVATFVPARDYTTRALLMDPHLMLFRRASASAEAGDAAGAAAATEQQRFAAAFEFPGLWEEARSDSDSSSVGSGGGWGPRAAFFDDER